MEALHIQYSPNIIMPHFPTVRLHNASKFAVGRTLLITYGKQKREIGEATIISMATVPYSKTTPILTAMLTGKDNPNYVRAILAKMYPGIQETDLLDWMVLVWKQRYLIEQQDLVKKWWDTQIATTPQYVD